MKLPNLKDFLLRSTYKTNEEATLEYAQECIKVLLNEMTETCLESYKRGYIDGLTEAKKILDANEDN